MARTVINYTVTDEGRDKAKVFVITEMAPARAEAWATRAILALMKANVDIPEGFDRLGMAGLAELGLKALGSLSYDVLEPLLAEMLTGVTVMPDPSKTHIVRNMIDGDIEEIMTLVKLRAEIWKLNASFFITAAPSIFNRGQAAAASNTQNM